MEWSEENCLHLIEVYKFYINLKDPKDKIGHKIITWEEIAEAIGYPKNEVDRNGKRSEEDPKISLEKPTLLRSTPEKIYSDPVKEERKKQTVTRKERERPSIQEKASIVSGKIEPTLSVRIALQTVNESVLETGDEKKKYEAPKSKKQQRIIENNRTNTAKYFCKYGKVKLPKPIPSRKLSKYVNVPSPEVSKAKVAPKRATPTASRLYPYSQSQEHLELKKPKSGVFINEDNEKRASIKYDSFELVYSKQPRPDVDWATGKKKKKKKKRSKDASGEGEEKVLATTEFQKSELEDLEETPEEMFGEGDADFTDLENFLTKQLRKKVSMMSQQTSYQSKDIKTVMSEKDLFKEPVNKYIQKFRRDSEIRRYEFKRRKFRRGTLQSHSFTNVNQEVLKKFFFGVTKGSMHQGDKSFPENIRDKQGLCMPIAAYCYSIIKHPNKWTSEIIDQILEIGNQLCFNSLNISHKHQNVQELKIGELSKYCVIGSKKLRFVIDEPDVIGQIRSNDKTVFNLTKALRIFFARNSSGLLKTETYSIAIWKDKYYYLFDAKPRTKDLYYADNGTALMANFYDIPSLASIFLGRSNFGNWPFLIYPLKVTRVLPKDAIDVDSNLNLSVVSNFNILNEKKAVCLGTFDLGDKCFEFSRGKQALAMAVISLVYSRITPASAWHRSTIDKIMIIGNQFFLECKECEEIDELRVDNLPAFFTIGPYIVEIYIYANMMADYLFKQCCCTLECSLDDFFERSTNGIIQIDKNKYIAVWKQRHLYFCFDPYSRNNEGYVCRDGSACVSMHVNLESLIETITKNFDQKDAIFRIHALRVCKIHRDPVQSQRFPKHLPMDEYPAEDFKKYKMKKSKKVAVEKPVSVDYTALAMIRLLTDERSIHEIGSGIESLAFGDHKFCSTPKKVPSLSILKSQPKMTDVIADLDSPSLSDTQIPPALPKELKSPVGEIEFIDLDSFELTMEEIELSETFPGEGEDFEGEGRGRPRRKLTFGGEGEEMEGGEEGEEEYMGGEDDWYYAMSRLAQTSMAKEPSKLSQEINTDITFFPIKREVLYPTYLRGKQQMRYRLQRYKIDESDWDTYLPPEPVVTQSQELEKETNFIKLPDDTEIIYGSKNVSHFGQEIEFIAPFIGIMAGVVSRKYSITSWNTDIVDYILRCGNELYSASKFRFDQVSKLEIPKITLGNTSFAVLVEYIFDTYTRQNILELAIEKILFVRSDLGVLVTPVYACGLIYKNHLYYLYDCFGNNEVGLGEGPSNEGSACVARFKDIRSLATRIMYNKKKREANEDVVYSRFVLSSMKIKEILLSEDESKGKKTRKSKKSEMDKREVKDEGEEAYDIEEEMKESERGEGKEEKDEEGEEEEKNKKEEKSQIEKKSKNKVGYQLKNKSFVIEGTKGLTDKSVSTELKEDHFICLCACLMLMTCPINKWDTQKIDSVMDNGSHVYSKAEDLYISERRIIKNILMEKHFFDLIVKRIKIENYKDRKNLNTAIETLLGRKLSYFILQFPNACYVLHQYPKGTFHLFNPYGVAKGQNAGWIRCQNLSRLKKLLKKTVRSEEICQFYNFEVTSIQKAPKDLLLSYKMQEYESLIRKKKEEFGKPFYEVVEWLTADPVPWSRRTTSGPSGKERGNMENMWHNWDIEYNKDLYSLMGNIHQISVRFSEETRGRQTLANLVVCIGMLEIYELAEWNGAVIDSVLVNGDNYFNECIKEISEKNYEISMDDLKQECSIFPFGFDIECTPVVEGTMFLVQPTQFNLYKALRYFFNKYDRRCGIICSKKSPTNKRHVAFGKLRESEYFMFDCECIGSPMFLDGCGVAYILRMKTLNRLLHVLTLTLRGGDFYIWDVQISELQPIN